MTKQRLDIELTARRLATSRSQAESWIKLGKVTVDGRVATKPGLFVRTDAAIKMTAEEQYVSRAGLKLASVAKVLNVDFAGKSVLDVGSSTGGFTDFALRRGAKKVWAVDVGTDQLHPSLRGNSKIELHEKTDIRDVRLKGSEFRVEKSVVLAKSPEIVVIDVSFISMREVLPSISQLLSPNSQVVAMLKPQFEAGREQVNKGGLKTTPFAAKF